MVDGVSRRAWLRGLLLLLVGWAVVADAQTPIILNTPQQPIVVNVQGPQSPSTVNVPHNNIVVVTPTSSQIGPQGTSGPVCGAVVNGKPQAPCDPVPAKFESDAVGTCPAGSVFDIGLWSCWSCPSGYQRTAEAVDTPRACAKPDASVQGQFMSARFISKLCPDGSFFDPIRGGECWSCPVGYKRSAASVEADNACYIPSGERLSRATRLKKTAWAWDCAKGTFFDLWDHGGCWSCPSGFNRTANPVYSDGACSAFVPEKQARATVVKKAACDAGEIQDPRNGGECWLCPTATTRTVFPIQEGKACEKWAGYRYSPATQTAALTCPAGQIFDPSSSKRPEIQSRIRAQYAGKPLPTFGKSDGGTCWSCPSGYQRSIGPVWNDYACNPGLIDWRPAPYGQPGLFGLNGGEEVALEVVREGKTIDAIADQTALATGKPAAEVRANVWQEIATQPQNSGALLAAVLARVEAAAVRPAQATDADRRLAASFAAAVRDYRIFIAKNALDAYDTWKVTNDYYKAQRRSSGPQLDMAFDYGTVPPDFQAITAGSVLGGIGGGAMSSTYTLAAITPQVKKAIFPHAHGRYLRAVQNHFAQQAGEDLTEKVGEKVAEKVGAEVAKDVGEAVGSTLADLLSKTGPQLIITMSIELIMESAQQVAEIQNARPILVTNLATAMQPFDIARLLVTEDGTAEVENTWSAAMNGSIPPRNIAAFAAAAQAMRVATNQPSTPSGGKTNQPPTPGGANTWQQMPGAGMDIGMGSGGTLWVLGSQAVPGGFEVFRWNGNTWVNMHGGAVSIDVDAQGFAWIVNDKGEIFHYSMNGWTKMPGLAKDIGVGPTAVWAIGVGAVQGGYGIFRWTNNNWQDMHGGAVRIDVDAQGNAWVVTDKNDVYRYTGSGWVPVPGIKARDIGVGADGSVFAVGTDDSVNKWTGNGWVKRDGRLVDITVDAHGIPFGVSANKQIWMGYQ